MELDRLNRWLTLAANIGVIASIIFLGYEIRQNTLVAKVEASNSLEENLFAMTSSIWSDPNFARVLEIGQTGGIGDLTSTEQLRLQVWYQQVLRGWQNAHFQYVAGTLDEQLCQTQEITLSLIFLADEGLIEYWQSSKSQYTPEFNLLVQSWMDAGAH